MIISHKYQIIFIHCRKTGGSSVKANLYPHLGDDDLMIGSIHEVCAAGHSLTPRIRREIIRPDIFPIFVFCLLRGEVFGSAVNRAIRYRYRKMSSNPPHPSANEIRKFFPQEWKNYRKVAFVRNPYTQVVSDYFWRRAVTGLDVSFSDFVLMLESDKDHVFLPSRPRSNWEMVSVDDSCCLDWVGRFETLHDDFATLVGILGIEQKIERSQKVGIRSKSSYSEIYDSNTRARVERIFAKDLEEFKYDWPFL